MEEKVNIEKGKYSRDEWSEFLEEARCQMLEKNHMPYSAFEEQGVMIPVLGVSCNYKFHVTFDDIIQVKPFVKNFNGVRLTMGYEVRNKKTGDLVLTGETKHCFTDSNLKPLRLQKQIPDFYDKFMKLKISF